MAAMSDWEPTERPPRDPFGDDGSDLPPTEAIPGQGAPTGDVPIVPMSDPDPVVPPNEPPPTEPPPYEPTVVMPPTTPPPGGMPPTPGGTAPPPPPEPWFRRRGPVAAVIGVGLALIFLLIAFLVWVNDDDDSIATSDSSTSVPTSSTTSTSVVATTTSSSTSTSAPSTSSTTTTSSTSTSTSSTTTSTTQPATTAAPTTTRAPTTTAAPATTRPAATTTTAVPAVSVPPAADTTVWDIVRASPDLSRLEELVQQAGLVDAIDVDDPITLLAPSNAALELLEEAPGGQELLDDPDLVRELLLGHIVEGEAISAADLFERDSIDVANGEAWEVDNAALTIDGAHVVFEDGEGANGLLHVVDKVLGT
jgi:uncharacterized surface protein with fasciclin (FAS1) repeats